MALGGYKVSESCETGMQSYSWLLTSLEQGSHFSCILLLLLSRFSRVQLSATP